MGSTNKIRLRTEVSWMSDEEHLCDCVVSYTGSFFLLVPFVIERTANRPTRVIQTWVFGIFPKMNEMSCDNNWPVFVAKDKILAFMCNQNLKNLCPPLWAWELMVSLIARKGCEMALPLSVRMCERLSFLHLFQPKQLVTTDCVQAELRIQLSSIKQGIKEMCKIRKTGLLLLLNFFFVLDNIVLKKCFLRYAMG